MLPGEPSKVIFYLSSNLLIMTDYTMKPFTSADSEALMYLNISEHLDWPSLDVIYTSLRRRAYIGFSKACGMKLRCRFWFNALQHLKLPRKLLTVKVQSLPMQSIGKDWRIRVRTLTTSHITAMMWWEVMLAQFLWNWVKLPLNIGPVEVHTINISPLTTPVLLLACTRKKKIPKSFKSFKVSSQLC